MKLKNTLILLLCACMLLPLAACEPPPDNPEQPSTDTQATSNEEITTTPEDEPEPVLDPIAAMKENLNAIKQNIGATTDTVLYVKDFGATGDGKTDDGTAIYNAVVAAAEQHATLKFEENKTYYVASAPGGRVTPFALSGAHGMTIDGCGSTILIAPNMRYIRFSDCGNVKMTNLHFDYAIPVYLVGKVKEVQGSTVVFEVDENPYVDHYDFAPSNGFSIAYNEGTQQRPHAFMTAMHKTADKEVSITYKGHTYREGQLAFLPNPGVAHNSDQVIDVRGSDQPMLFENIGVHAASTFVWALFHNQDHLFFENVDLVPAPNNDKEIKMVAWRDGYHCKNNTAGIHWNNCEADVLFDDVFNIAATLGVVSEVTNNNVFSIKNYENPADVFICSPGDTVDIYDLKSGTYKGNARVRSVVSNADGSRTITLYYGQTINEVTEGCVVANRDTAAPGSTITNCHFQGTFRYLRNLYVENTVFDLLVIWMMVEGSVEGPMPGNVDFVNCTFNGGEIQIDAYNRNTAKRMRKIGKEIVDIGFWGCTFNNKTRITTSTDATYTENETFTSEELYTIKNRMAITDPQSIAPTESDVALGVSWDWSLFTMPMTGNSATVTPLSSLSDRALADKLNVENVSDSVLALSAVAGEKLYLDGMSKSALSCLYQKGTSYIIKLTYYTDTPVKASLMIGNTVITDDLFATTGEVTTFSTIYNANGNGNIAYIEYNGAGTVYLGELTLAAFVNANPSLSQLESGHTFVWDSNVTIKGGEVINAANITDAAAKEAILAAPDKFGQSILHLDRGMAEFTGLTKKTYFSAGTTYRISIDAYIASPISEGSTMYLLAMDGTPGNRVLKQGIFHGEGMYHFEMDWQVGTTGERQLKFFIDNAPAAYADIYVGNFTITKMPGLAPNKTMVPDQMTQATKEQLQAGFTYDFASGIFFETSKNTYVDTSCLSAYAKETLANAGFGEYAYYYNENFDAIALGNPLYGGNRYTITMKVYDCKGNLDDNARGAFVLLNMTGGGQNSAECNYKITADPNVAGLYTITFTEVPPMGTDTLRFYQIEPCEFYIASITVKVG